MLAHQPPLWYEDNIYKWRVCGLSIPWITYGVLILIFMDPQGICRVTNAPPHQKWAAVVLLKLGWKLSHPNRESAHQGS